MDGTLQRLPSSHLNVVQTLGLGTPMRVLLQVSLLRGQAGQLGMGHLLSLVQIRSHLRHGARLAEPGDVADGEPVAVRNAAGSLSSRAL